MSDLASTQAILQKLVRFDTTSRNSNLELIEWIEDYLKPYGVQLQRIENEEKTKAALLGTLAPSPSEQNSNRARRGGNGHEGERSEGEYPPHQKGIVFSGHTDVVPVDGQNWNTPPFKMTEKAGKLYGRGTCDMKGFIACVLAMVPHWSKLILKRPLHFAFSFDEEIGCRAAARIGEFIKAQSWNPMLVIVGEPTMMQPVAAHKGIYSFLTTVTGKEAHSSQTHIGVNAIAYAAKLIAKLDELAQHCHHHQDAEFCPPYSTLQVGVIQGGTARNIIPKQCQFEWEIRPLPQDEPPVALENFMAFQAELNAQMKAISTECGVETTPVTRVLSLKPEAQESLQHLMLRLSESNAFQSVSYGTEAGILQSHGLPCYICGPGSIQQAHIPNEYVEVEQIEKCLRFMQRIENITSI
jgi:acetylornithine deacetylase